MVLQMQLDLGVHLSLWYVVGMRRTATHPMNRYAIDLSTTVFFTVELLVQLVVAPKPAVFMKCPDPDPIAFNDGRRFYGDYQFFSHFILHNRPIRIR